MAKLTPIKAIRAKCRDCTCNQVVEIRECPITDCPLWEYRMGHRPKNEDSAGVNELEGVNEDSDIDEPLN